MIIPRLLKCQWCKDSGEKDVMQKGVTKTGYIHIDCIPKYEEEQRRKKIEKEELNELYEYLLELHEAIEFPKWSMSKLVKFKNDKNISYKLILDAYKYAEDKIKWTLDNVVDCKNNASGFNAGITLMIKHGINPVYQQEQMRKKREEDRKKIKKIEPIATEEIINYKKQSNKKDISKFL